MLTVYIYIDFHAVFGLYFLFLGFFEKISSMELCFVEILTFFRHSDSPFNKTPVY